MARGLLLLLYFVAIVSMTNCQCETGKTCETPDGGTGICTAGVCAVIPTTARKDLKFAIVVKYPEMKLKVN